MDELLLRSGGAVLDLHVHGGSLVLVVGEPVLGPVVPSVVAAVQGLDHVVGLSHATVVSLNLLGALEEDHVAAEDLHDGVLVEGGLREGPGDVVAIVVTVNHHLPPDGILSGKSLRKVNIVPDVLGVGLQVDLEVGVQHVHLGEDAGQSAHLGGNVVLELVKILQELSEVLLSDLNEAIGLPLVSEVVEEKVLQSVGVDGRLGLVESLRDYFDCIELLRREKYLPRKVMRS